MKSSRSKNLILPFLVIGCTLLIIGSTYAWFTLTLEGTKEQVVTTGTLALVLDDTTGSGITLDQAAPTIEELAMKQAGYTFTLENTGDIDSKYTIYLDDLPLLDSEIRLEDKYIRYNIQNDQGLNKTRLFSQLKPSPNRVLDSGTIAPGKKYTYTLRVWLDYDADNGAMGKTFKGKIRVEAQQDIEYLPATLMISGWSNELQTTTGRFWDYKANVTKVVIQNEKKKPVGVVQEWDVSTTNDGTVMAYLTGEEVAGYTLYLQANGPIHANTNSSKLFRAFTRLQTIEGLENLDTSQVTTMDYMFQNCSSLTTIELSSFDTSQVTDMDNMFQGCIGLVELELSNFNTSNVNSMRYMFDECNKLLTLDLSHFDTGKVKDMEYMFLDCQALTTLDLSHFNTSNVTLRRWMFMGCSSLTLLDLSGFNTSKVTNMDRMFSGCSSLTTLDLSSFDTSKVTNMSAMFFSCTNLIALELSNFNTSLVTDMSHMFQECRLITKLNLSNFNTSNATNMRYMFSDCNQLSTIDLSSFDTSKVENMELMFFRCEALTTLDLFHFNTTNVTNMKWMFSNCINITGLNLSNFNTSKVTDMSSMFSSCSRLAELNLSNFNTSKVTDMEWMFSRCSSLTVLNISNFDVTNVTVMEWMFNSISPSTQILVKDAATQTWVINQNSNFSTSNVLIATV